ncbi:MAG: hypothetical protein Q9202_004322 [Teloschistes flavicans]
MINVDSGSVGTIAITVVTFLAVTIAVVSHLFGPKYDPNEPPVVHSKLPFFGHIVGLLRHGLRYFELLSTKYPIPIFTLYTFGRRIYVVNSPDLISAVQKDAKNLTFGPFVSWMSPRIFDVGDEAMAAINENTDGTKGMYGLLPEITRGMHNALAPSTSLDWMTKTMLTKLGEYVDPLGAGPDGIEIDLFKWVRTAFTVASTEAAYGPKNPFNHKPNLEDDFWDFENDITMIMLGVLPSITARKGYRARIRFTEALNEYFNNNGPETGSDMIKARWAVNVKYNMAKYAGCFEIGDLIGVLVNASPCFFWTLVHIFSRPALLAELRAEIAGIVEETSEATAASGTGRTVRSIPVSKLKEHCPLLLSTYQETLRVQTHNANTRWVKTDTLLADRYFLKADSVIQIPGYPVHMLPSIWGPDAQSFNPHRFIKIEKKKDRGENRVKQHPASFRSFGGGATLCPGRHFATAEICAAAAMFVMRFEVAPVGDGGEWNHPDWAHGKVSSAVPPPAKDVRVKVSTRKGEEGVDWRWGFEGSVSKFDVVG